MNFPMKRKMFTNVFFFLNLSIFFIYFTLTSE